MSVATTVSERGRYGAVPCGIFFFFSPPLSVFSDQMISCREGAGDPTVVVGAGVLFSRRGFFGGVWEI